MPPLSTQMRGSGCRAIETGGLTQLATDPVFTIRDLKAIAAKCRQLIPEYMEDYVSVNQFVA